MVLMIAYLSWLLALSFIGGKLSDCDWWIQNDAYDFFPIPHLFIQSL